MMPKAAGFPRDIVKFYYSAYSGSFRSYYCAVEDKPMHAAPQYPAQRTVINADALEWLRLNPAKPFTSVITSLPDVSELNLAFDEWRSWFIDTAVTVLNWIPHGSCAIFFQSDIKHNQVWIDKSFLIQIAAERANGLLLWHKILCRKPPGTIALGRPSYSHMLCIARGLPAGITRPGPDVLADVGYMNWPKAMGLNACRIACRFLAENTATALVVDPFCGKGSILAAANHMGFAALGVERSPKRCRAALSLTI